MSKFYLRFWISLLVANGFDSIFSVEKPIVVLVASYNNQLFAKKNITSILEQDYENFRVIYIDDASDDKTLNEVTRALKDHPKKSLFEIYHNHLKLGAMQNHYMAISKCKKNEIMVILDGDDWFFSSQSLKIINACYENEDTWLTWGSYIEYPSGEIGNLSKPVSKSLLLEGKLRQQTWTTSHCRTFYAGLFQKVKKEEFMMDGKFFSSGCDLAEMFPMLEMARERAKFIPDLLYVYNKSNPISDSIIHAKDRDEIVKIIRRRPALNRLNHFN